MYYKFFNLFLEVENELLSRIQQLEYTEKSKLVYSSKLSLLLLQTCPIIESYMVYLSSSSNEVKQHELYDWEYNWKLWKSEKKRIKVKNGIREIETFPKFSYVVEKVFSLSSISVIFFHTERLQDVKENTQTSNLKPFSSLKKFNSYKDFKGDGAFPIGLETPKWWTAYNKIKHSLIIEAQERVTYGLTVEAISALFSLLSKCAPDRKMLENHGYLNNGVVRTKLFKEVINN